MPRSKSRVPSRERRKKILKAAKGFYGRRKSNIRIAIDAVAHAGQYAYAHRRDKKGDFRTLWITRLNAAVREHGTLDRQVSKIGISLLPLESIKSSQRRHDAILLR